MSAPQLFMYGYRTLTVCVKAIAHECHSTVFVCAGWCAIKVVPTCASVKKVRSKGPTGSKCAGSAKLRSASASRAGHT